MRKWNDLKGCDAVMRANSQTLPERLAVVAGDNLKGPTVRISLAGVADGQAVVSQLLSRAAPFVQPYCTTLVYTRRKRKPLQYG